MRASGHEHAGIEQRTLPLDSARMIEFTRRWAPFGGGDEYILPEFGLLPSTYYERLLAVLDSPRPIHTDRVTQMRLLDLCRQKIGLPLQRR